MGHNQEERVLLVHLTRVITSVIGLALLISIILFGNLLLFWLIVSTAIVIGLLEFYHLAETHYPVYKLPGIMLGWLVSLASLLYASVQQVTLSEFTLSLVILALFLYVLFCFLR